MFILPSGSNRVAMPNVGFDNAPRPASVPDATAQASANDALFEGLALVLGGAPEDKGPAPASEPLATTRDDMLAQTEAFGETPQQSMDWIRSVAAAQDKHNREANEAAQLKAVETQHRQARLIKQAADAQHHVHREHEHFHEQWRIHHEPQA